MSLIDLLRAAAGEVSVSPAVNRWREKVSLLLGEISSASFVQFPYLRVGEGATAPTIVEAGPTLGYVMDIGDFLYAEAFLHPLVNRNSAIILAVSWAPTASEADKVVTWRAAVGHMKPGAVVSTIDVTKTQADIAVSATAATYQRTSFTLQAAEWNTDPDIDELHIRLTRVASELDPDNDPGIHHLAVIQTLRR